MISREWWARTAEQVKRAKQRLGKVGHTERVVRVVGEGAQRLRQQLDQVILTRLPSFRDVVDTKVPATESQPEQSAEDALEEKRRAAQKVIDRHAGYAVANAFNPIPGLDVGLDLSILTSLSRTLAATYELNDQQAAALAQGSTPHMLSYPAAHQLIERFAPRLVQGAVVATLRRAGLPLLARETARWLPLTGSVVAAGIGYRMIRRMGEELRQECEAAARAAEKTTVEVIAAQPLALPAPS